ncbi:MAG: recombinase family protein [Candidatus Scalindua sp. AMX11]|nr:recombinase family protein [Planctomycetota bacterium]RZV61136.1 MAG: recombinase family protein [Candidatus Scalindua sp. SCAELEC01]TDE63175.1 MAG: recombinase family protein [Candidatus Scalindua sp. AMX11]
MKIGYARVSTLEQNTDMQKKALKKAGCEKVLIDKVSGTVAKRPGLEKAKELLRKGDTLVVWRLDRLGRSLRDLIEWVRYLDEKGVGLESLHETINTSTPTGKLTFHLFGALAEFERNLIQERTQAGLAAARARGRRGGRRKALDKEKRNVAVNLYLEKKMTVGKICELMGISKPTLYSYIRAEVHPYKTH